MNANQIETDVIIIGAGPAGSATSIFLSKYGIPHVIIEKGVFPRDKVCGDACSGRTTQVISKADSSWLQEMRALPHQFHPTWGMTVVAPNEKMIDIPYVTDKSLQTNAKGFTVPRLIFDNFLFQKLPSPHATIYQNATVDKLEEDVNRITVNITSNAEKVTINAKTIVGADGDKSIVRRTFMQNDASLKAAAVGLRAYYDGVEGMYDPYHIELHYLKELPSGYLWIFPLPNGRANVGIGMLSETVRAKKVNLREVFLNAINNHPRFKQRFKEAKLLGKIDGWGIPIYTQREPVCGTSYLLTGDAARLVDPFSGEGVGNALFSGMLAAEAIHSAITNNDFSAAFFKQAYEVKLYHHLGPELEQNAAMQRVFLKQWLFNLFFNKAFKSQTLRNAVSHMFTDAEMHKQFKKPSFYLKVLLNK